jgi:hypothetical protein
VEREFGYLKHEFGLAPRPRSSLSSGHVVKPTSFSSSSVCGSRELLAHGTTIVS